MEKPYVFISYAHRDSDKVLPCIDAMRRSGIDLWYDEGIEAGSEWPEFIAEKVVNCTKFVLFISDAYLQSQNCKRELNFAISRKKDILSIFLEDVNLSPGVEMQLGTYQAIYRNRFESAEAFHNSLCREGYFNPCRSGAASQATQQPETNPAGYQSSGSNTGYQPSGGYQGNTGTIGQQSNSGFNKENWQDLFNKYVGGNQTTATQTDVSDNRPVKNRMLAALLAFFLGSFGAQKFYLGQTKKGILYLIFFWTYIPMILSFIECLMLVLTTNEKFEEKYNCRAG